MSSIAKGSQRLWSSRHRSRSGFLPDLIFPVSKRVWTDVFQGITKAEVLKTLEQIWFFSPDLVTPILRRMEVVADYHVENFKYFSFFFVWQDICAVLRRTMKGVHTCHLCFFFLHKDAHLFCVKGETLPAWFFPQVSVIHSCHIAVV